MARSLLIVLAMLCAAPMPVSADSIVKGMLTAEPQVSMKNGTVAGCGVRVVGMREVLTPSAMVAGFDVSFMLYANGVAVLKGIADADFKASDLLTYQKTSKRPFKNVPLKTFWIKARDKDAPTPLNGKTIAGETPMSLLYAADFGLVGQLLNPVLDQEPIQIGIQRVSDHVATVYYGAPKMSPTDIQQLANCLSDLQRAMEKGIATKD